MLISNILGMRSAVQLWLPCCEHSHHLDGQSNGGSSFEVGGQWQTWATRKTAALDRGLGPVSGRCYNHLGFLNIYIYIHIHMHVERERARNIFRCCRIEKPVDENIKAMFFFAGCFSWYFGGLKRSERRRCNVAGTLREAALNVLVGMERATVIQTAGVLRTALVQKCQNVVQWLPESSCTVSIEF